MADSNALGVLADIQKIFNKGSKKLNIGMADAMVEDHEVISSGIPVIDYILGTRGLMGTKVYELYGPESSGKSLVAYNMIAACQQAGKVVLFYDAERSSDNKIVHRWMAAQDVDVPSLVYMRQESAESACDVLVRACSDERVGLMVIDSIAWMSLASELSKQMDEKSMQGVANVLPEYLKKHTQRAKSARLLIINQVRDNVGGGKYAPETRNPGGRAVRFACAARLEVKANRITVKQGDTYHEIGIKISITNRKNKLSTPFKSNYFNLYWKDFGKFKAGIDHVDQLVRLGLLTGAIEQKASWMVFETKDGTVKGQGLDGFCANLAAQPWAFGALAEKVLDLRTDSYDITPDAEDLAEQNATSAEEGEADGE